MSHCGNATSKISVIQGSAALCEQGWIEQLLLAKILVLRMIIELVPEA
jgi:hypothetical protein